MDVSFVDFSKNKRVIAQQRTVADHHTNFKQQCNRLRGWVGKSTRISAVVGAVHLVSQKYGFHDKKELRLRLFCFCKLFFFAFRLALYVYEYLLHVGAQKSAQTFLSEVRHLHMFPKTTTNCKILYYHPPCLGNRNRVWATRSTASRWFSDTKQTFSCITQKSLAHFCNMPCPKVADLCCTSSDVPSVCCSFGWFQFVFWSMCKSACLHGSVVFVVFTIQTPIHLKAPLCEIFFRKKPSFACSVFKISCLRRKRIHFLVECFLQIRWEKNITLGEPPGFLHSWWW